MKLLNTINKTMTIGILVASTAVSTFATTVTDNTLTLEQAVNRAINSCDKKTVYGRYLDAYEQITKYNKDMFSSVYRSNKLAEMTYEFNMKHINDKIAYDTTDTYLNVICLKKQMELVDNQISIANKVLNQVKIKLDKGMASELDYKKAQDDLKDLDTQKLALQKSLDNEVMDFKNLTNMDITKYQLDTSFNIEPAKIDEPAEAYFDRKLEDYYGLTKEQNDIDQLHKIYEMGSDVGTYMLQEAKIASGEYTLDNLKETMSTTLMSYYNNLDSVKASIDNYDTQIAAEQDNLKAYEIRYNNGYISKLDYEQALLKEQSLECEKFAKIKTYVTTKMIVEEPNILAMK